MASDSCSPFARLYILPQGSLLQIESALRVKHVQMHRRILHVAFGRKGVSFREQFKGLVNGITIGDGDNQIDALSGATITSQAVVDGVNAALRCIWQMGLE